MNFEDAMTQMKAGHVVKRATWKGHARIEGLFMIRVKPGIHPFQFRASKEDKAALDWVASAPPPRSTVPTRDVRDVIKSLTQIPEGYADPVDERGDRG